MSNCGPQPKELYGRFRGSKATLYGNVMEPVAESDYVAYQNQHGHPGLITSRIGLIISVATPYIAASPDGRVHDPTYAPPDGLVEIKNPYSSRDKTIEEASESKNFYLQKGKKDNGEVVYKRHDYYFQIQCQLYCAWANFDSPSFFLSIGQEKPVSLTSVLSAFEFLLLPQKTFNHSFQCWYSI